MSSDSGGASSTVVPTSTRRIAGSAYEKATRLAVIAAGFSAVFMTVCSNQPITAVYLVNQLGASPELLGALFGFIQATGALQLVSVFIYRVLPSRKPFFIAVHLLHRFLTFALAVSALLFIRGLEGPKAATFAALGIGLSWIFMGLSTSGWLSWMADLVPEDVRGTFFLRRSALYQTVVVIWFFLANVALDLVPKADRSVAYLAIFGVGSLAGIVEILIHLRIPEPSFDRDPGPMKAREFFAPLRDANFLRYSIGIGLAVFAVFLGQPFQAPRITDPAAIGAPYVWLGIMTVISILAWVAMAPLWGFVMDRYGRKPAVILGCLLVAGWTAFFFMDHRNYPYLLPVVALVSGFFGPAFWEGSGQFMLTLAPPPRRVPYIAWYNTIVGLVSAAGAPLGGLILGAFPPGSPATLPPIIPEIGGFRLAQAAGLLAMALAMLVIRGVREGRERPVAGLIGQMASAGLFRTYSSLLDLRHHSGDPRVGRALRRIDGDEGELVIREVLDRLDDPEAEIREEAVRALARIGSEEARLALEARLADPGSDLRVEAARAIGRLGDLDSLPALESALRDGDPVLRAACAGAIASLSGRAEGSSLALLLAAELDSTVIEAAALGASTWGSEDVMGADELVEAEVELAGRLFSARNRASRLQYAIGIANLLGKPGQFARLSTGSEELRAAKRRSVVDSLERRFEGLFAYSKESPLPAERLLSAFDEGDGAGALGIVVDAGRALVDRIFGDYAGADETELIMRADARLAAWIEVSRIAEARMKGPGGSIPASTAAASSSAESSAEAGLLVALVGAWYLASD